MDKIAQRHRDRCRTYALISEDLSSTIKTTGEEFNNDEGDCDGSFNRQQNQQPKFPNGRIPIGQ